MEVIRVLFRSKARPNHAQMRASANSHRPLRGRSRLLLPAARPNSSFNPNPLRSTNNMAGRACHVVGSTTPVGVTQALGAYNQALKRFSATATKRKNVRKGKEA